MAVASYFYMKKEPIIETISYSCSECGYYTTDEKYIDDLCFKWEQNPGKFDQQTLQYQKALKKGYKL